MTRFIIKKLLIMALTVFLISLAVFFIITLPPGDFMTNYVGRMLAAGERVNQEEIEALRRTYALDQPFIIQFWSWFSKIIFKGDFGYSFSLSMPVTAVRYPTPCTLHNPAAFSRTTSFTSAISASLSQPLRFRSKLLET